MGVSVEGWKKVKLVDICIKIGSGATPTGGANAYKTSGISLIRSQNVLDFSFSLDGLAFIDDVQAEKLKSVIIEEEDVLLNITGDSVARSCIVPNSILPARVNQHVSIVRVEKNKASNKFVFYYTQYIKPFLLSIASNGGTRNALTKTMIEQLDILLPSLSEQKTIAATLSALDDAIELNNQINKNLEEIAQAIFKSWFVDFEPFKEGEFEESELGLIPKGWSVGKFTDYINVLSGGTPKTSVAKYWNGDIPFFTPKDSVNGFYCIKTEKCITEFGLNKCNSRKYEKDTVFITARGTVGKINLSGSNIAMNQSCYALQGKNGLSQYFVFLLTKQCLEMLKKNANGAVFDSIIVNTFGAIRFMLPPREVINKFNTLIQPLFEMNHSCCMETEKLVSLRDTLLPKLMSGEIRVPVKEAV